MERRLLMRQRLMSIICLLQGKMKKRDCFQILDMLVKECRARGIAAISLEATDMGRPLYEKYGFIKMEHEMELPENTEKEIDNGH